LLSNEQNVEVCDATDDHRVNVVGPKIILPPIDTTFATKKVENKGLLFIPDISGFTQFVNQTDIEHSRLIIQELLEILINANEIGLEVSEVEGDAILFYKFGESPGLDKLYQQVEKMFVEFHRHLGVYDLTRYCQCNACRSAISLSLKVITHYGEFAGYNVKNFSKLIGKDVIVAHQLLKNDIEQHEYWLITPQVIGPDRPPDLTQWMKWDSSAKQTDNGEITFHYTQLTQLKNDLQAEPPRHLELTNKVKVLSLSKEYDAAIIPLFHAAGDFNYRSQWQEGVKAVEEVSHFLPRVGMRNRRILENGEVVSYASSYSFTPERIEFSETDEDKKNSIYFILEKISDNKTKLTVDFYIKKNSINQISFKLGRKKKMEEEWKRSLENLDRVVKEIKLPG
jgi:hypothetical protein